MQASIPVDRGDVNRLGELIALDRSSAGESRHASVQVPLQTALYTAPLRVVLKQRWREERRACVAVLGGVATLFALLGFLLVAPASLARSSTQPAAKRPARAVPGPLRAASRPAATPGAVSAPSAIASPDSRPSTSVEPALPALSVQLRLQRADLWLRIGTPRAALEARRLLESALAERPGSAHGYAALAQACLILEDQGCAREAIDQAQRVRPWRAGYRTLSRHIERAFESQP